MDRNKRSLNDQAGVSDSSKNHKKPAYAEDSGKSKSTKFKVAKSDAEKAKEAGDRLYQDGKYAEAVEKYTLALRGEDFGKISSSVLAFT